MATRIPNASQGAGSDAITGRINAGAAAGTLDIRSGAQPADADDAASGTLLCTITLADPAYAAWAAGSAALAGTPRSGVGLAAGAAGWFRAKDSDGNTAFDGSVTGTGGGGDLELDNVNIAVDQVVNINSLSFTIPASE